MKVPTTTFSIQCIGSLATGSVWYPLIQQSAAAWNNSTNTNISITTSSSVYTCEVDSYPQTWYGMTTSYYSGSNTNSAIVQINSRTCSSDNGSRKSTITHEIGHLLGLADNPPVSGNSSLMHYDRNRATIYVPQAYDIMNVKYIYGIS